MRSSLILLFALAVGALIAAANTSAESSPSNGTERTRIRQGLRIAPVPLDLRGKNRDLVGLGSYIVNAQGGCNDCHTNPSYVEGGNPFQGEPEQVNTEHYLAGGRQFGPDIVSANITPDENGRPAGVTLSEFLNYLRTGRDPDEEDEILQVMPWPVFGKMTTHDLRAVYEYLRSIPHAEPGP